MDKIAIFCSASEAIDPMYFEAARELGEWLGKHGRTLVYGGADAGLMECVARAAKEAGATVMGVVPVKLEERGLASDLPDVTFRTDSLSDRKDILLNEADAAVALPGGVGTLDEVFHTVAAASLDYHRKPVILYNIGGFWDGLLAFLSGLADKGFIHHGLAGRLLVANDLEELAALIE